MDLAASSLSVSQLQAIEALAYGCLAIVIVAVVAVMGLIIAAVAWAWSNGVLNDPVAARELLDRKESRRYRIGGRAQASSSR